MKENYPYSKELKTPRTYGSIDYEKLIFDGKMQKAADFMIKPVLRFKPRKAFLETGNYSSADGSQIRYFMFSPKDSGNEKKPAIIYYHGGGFMFPLQLPMMKNSELYAANTGVKVFLPDFRTSMDVDCRTILEDCYGMMKFVFEHAEALDVDSSRIILYGDSAGGALAECTALLNLKRDRFPLCGQLLIYPVCDIDSWKYKSMEQYREAPWSYSNNLQMWRLFLMRGADNLEYFVPMHNNLAGLPPSYIEALEVDTLRDEAVAYAEKLKAAGVCTECKVIEGAYHGYDAELKSPLVQKVFQHRYQVIRNLTSTD